MAKKRYRVSHEIKEEILDRIKNKGLSVSETAEEYGLATGTIYSWLGTKAKRSVTLLQYNKLKCENEQLKQVIGDLTLKLSREEKRG